MGKKPSPKNAPWILIAVTCLAMVPLLISNATLAEAGGV